MFKSTSADLLYSITTLRALTLLRAVGAIGVTEQIAL